jgi:CDP-6-deoxy-D-xylo-4-hexulose-3-dehydrase
MDDPALLAHAVAYRDWGRYGDDNEDAGQRFALTIDGIPYDRKFVYSKIGFNFKPTEMQAAFGLVQVAKLAMFNRTRGRNFRRFRKYFERCEEFFILPEDLPNARAYWLAFPLTIRQGAPFQRIDIINYLERRNIQVRLLFSGNILRQPAFQNIERRVVGTLENTDAVMRNSFVFGCHHGMTDAMVDYVCGVFDDFLRPYRRQ